MPYLFESVWEWRRLHIFPGNFGCFDAPECKTHQHQNSVTRPSLVSERFASSASFQYYSHLQSIDDLATYVKLKVCPKTHQSCQDDAERISSADKVDIDYDTISQTLTFDVYFHQATSAKSLEGPKVWHEDIAKYDDSFPTEVGIFQREKATESEDLSLGGFLIDIGKTDRPSMLLLLIDDPC